MNTLQIVYKILKALDQWGGVEHTERLISPTTLDITPAKWIGVISLLVDEGCISKVQFGHDIYGGKTANINNARITLKGAEYLYTNDVMRKYGAVVTDTINL